MKYLSLIASLSLLQCPSYYCLKQGWVSHPSSSSQQVQFPIFSISRCSKDIILTERPVIGVMTQELTPELKALFPQHKSYLLSSYVKFMEQAGAQVVPIMIDRSDDYYETMFNSINGLLLPGGEVNISNSGKWNRALSLFSFLWLMAGVKLILFAFLLLSRKTCIENEHNFCKNVRTW